jgi:hypothetical protein
MSERKRSAVGMPDDDEDGDLVAIKRPRLDTELINPSGPKILWVEAEEFKLPLITSVLCIVADYLPPGRARLFQWRCSLADLVDPQKTAELLAIEDDQDGLQTVLREYKTVNISYVVSSAIRANAHNILITKLIDEAKVSPDLVLRAAASAGNLVLLAWSIAAGAREFDDALVEAVVHDQQHAMVRLVGTGKITKYHHAICAAGEYGKVLHMCYLRQCSLQQELNEDHGTINTRLLCSAAEKNDVSMLELVFSWTGAIPVEDARSDMALIVGRAAVNNSTQVLDWARTRAVGPGSMYVAAAAADAGGALEYMRDWPKPRGYVGMAFLRAAHGGQTVALRLIFDHLKYVFDEKEHHAPLRDDFYNVRGGYDDDYFSITDRDLVMDSTNVGGQPTRPYFADDPAATSPSHGVQSYLQRALMRAVQGKGGDVVKELRQMGARTHWRIVEYATFIGNNLAVKHLLADWEMSDDSFAKLIAAFSKVAAEPAWLDLEKVTTNPERRKQLLRLYIAKDDIERICAFVFNTNDNGPSIVEEITMTHDYLLGLIHSEKFEKLSTLFLYDWKISNYIPITHPVITIMESISNEDPAILASVCQSGKLTQYAVKLLLATLNSRINDSSILTDHLGPRK